MIPPAQNRVTPLGEIVAAPGRGAWMGNRGMLHANHPHARTARQVVRASRGRAWIICTLSFKDRRLPQWEPGRNTQLFFLDEAVALAAGHRPCAECRRSDYNAYRVAWAVPGRALPSAKDVDAQLDSERGRLHDQPWSDLPDGAFVSLDGGPAVLVGDHLRPWRPDNTYGPRLGRPDRGRAPVITPPGSLRVLRAGYPVQVGAEPEATSATHPEPR